MLDISCWIRIRSGEEGATFFCFAQGGEGGGKEGRREGGKEGGRSITSADRLSLNEARRQSITSSRANIPINCELQTSEIGVETDLVIVKALQRLHNALLGTLRLLE